MSPTILWLIAGIVFIGVEIFGIPGIGFLFAGIAAIVVGGGIEFGLIAVNDLLSQFVLFFLISCISAALLWKRLKSPKPSGYSNIIGTEAVVAGSGLYRSDEGQVNWSGALMRARIEPDAAIEAIAAGTTVIVRAIDGNLLFVTPKN